MIKTKPLLQLQKPKKTDSALFCCFCECQKYHKNAAKLPSPHFVILFPLNLAKKTLVCDQQIISAADLPKLTNVCPLTTQCLTQIYPKLLYVLAFLANQKHFAEIIDNLQTFSLPGEPTIPESAPPAQLSLQLIPNTQATTKQNPKYHCQTNPFICFGVQNNHYLALFSAAASPQAS